MSLYDNLAFRKDKNMAKISEQPTERNRGCIFISAKEKLNIEEFRTMIYKKVRELHVQKYPYNDFLYADYDGFAD